MVKIASGIARDVRRYISWLLLAGLLVAATYYFLNARKEPIPISSSQQNVEEPLVISKPEMREFELDTLKFYLVAEKAQFFERKKTVTLLWLYAELFEKDKSVAVANIKANHGEMDNNSGLLHLWGDVRLNTPDGQRMLTEELYLNRTENILYNEVTVIAYSGNDKIEAASMHYNITEGILLLKTPLAKIKI